MINIANDTTGKRFVSSIDGNVAYVDYLRFGETLEVIHTEVPTELSGRGIAAQLVEYAFVYAADHNLKFVPSCPYAIAWLKRHHPSNSFNKL